MCHLKMGHVWEARDTPAPMIYQNNENVGQKTSSAIALMYYYVSLFYSLT